MGWLLLLLRDGESYGRALFGGLSERGITVDSNHAYRTLRALDRDGAVASRWTASDAGPPRRTYRLTPEGRRRLTDAATTIAAIWLLHETFLRAYEAVRDAEGPLHGEHHAVEAGEPSHQNDDDEQAALVGDDGACVRAAPSERTRAPTTGRDLLSAWLLLLLERGASYGYGLRRALEAERVRADPGALYRVLRQLERDGLLKSRWVRSRAGPRRRLYRATLDGRHRLEALAAAASATCDRHAAFLQAYGRPRAGGPSEDAAAQP